MNCHHHQASCPMISHDSWLAIMWTIIFPTVLILELIIPQIINQWCGQRDSRLLEPLCKLIGATVTQPLSSDGRSWGTIISDDLYIQSEWYNWVHVIFSMLMVLPVVITDEQWWLYLEPIAILQFTNIQSEDDCHDSIPPLTDYHPMRQSFATAMCAPHL